MRELDFYLLLEIALSELDFLAIDFNFSILIVLGATFPELI